MSAVGIDPTFTKAYRLLFSNEPDSAEQMRAMLDDALKQKYGTHKTLTSVLPKKLMIEETTISKIERSHSPSPTITPDEPDSEADSNHTPDNDDDELTLDLLEEDLTCVVCKQMAVGARNRLVECLECHSLYHQECHQPPITEADIDDPRLAWYCVTCKKNMNKAISNIKSTKPTIPTGGKPPFTSSKSYSNPKSSSLSKPSSKSSGASGSNNSNNSSNNNSSNSASGSSSGSSGAAAKANKPSSSSTSKAAIPNINIISADKRLQLMKKKAAAANKNQDKVKHSK